MLACSMPADSGTGDIPGRPKDKFSFIGGNRFIKKAWAISSQRAVYLLTFDSPQTLRSALPKMVMLYLETERQLTSLRENPDYAAATPTLWCSRAA